MPQHKVVFGFRPSVGAAATANSVHGWTETFFKSTNEDDSACIDAAKLLMKARLKVLTPGWRCRFITAYRFPGARVGEPYSVDPDEGKGTYPLLSDLDEQPYDVCIVAISSASGRARHWGMRGISSNVIDAGGTYLAPTSFVRAFKSFRDRLVADGWAIKASSAAGKFHIDAVSLANAFPAHPGTPRSPVLVYDNIGAFIPATAGDTMRISGGRSSPGLTGTWNVRSAVLDTGNYFVRLSPKRAHKVEGLYDDDADSQIITYSLSNITEATPGDGSSHKAGGLPGRRRGRRPNQGPRA